MTTKLHAWEQTNLSWKNFSGPVLIVYYEDLVDDVEKTLRNILKFIAYHPINEDLVQCAVNRKEGIYRRKKRFLAFDPYSTTMKRMIEEKRTQVYAELGRNKKPK